MPEIDVEALPSRSLYRKLIVRSVGLIKWLMERTLLPYMSWAAKESGLLPSLAATKPYVQSSGPVNPLLLMAAFNDKVKDLQDNPELCQAKLNSILETIAYCDVIRDAGLKMFGVLVASGIPPDVALGQYLANGIELGMYVERRLQSANVEESRQPKRAPK